MKSIPVVGAGLDHLVFGGLQEKRFKRIENTLGEIAAKLDEKGKPTDGMLTEQFLNLTEQVTEEVSYDTAYEVSQKSISELLPVAEELGITMCLENVWNKFLLSPLEMRDYIDSFNHTAVTAYFDVGNILLYGYPHQWIEILGDRIKKVHIKDFNVGTRQFVGLLQGDVDYRRVMAAFRDIGYDGYLTAELSAYSQFPEQFLYDTAAQMDALLNC